jgi:hypothetical protein
MNPRVVQTGPLVLALGSWESQEIERILQQDKRAVLCRDLGTHGVIFSTLAGHSSLLEVRLETLAKARTRLLPTSTLHTS